MPLKATLTSADLKKLRESARGAPDPLGVAAELADVAQAGHLADPQDAGLALTYAAEIAENRTKLDAALRYVERALAAYEERDDTEVGAARALRARILFRIGRAEEATAELESLRPLLTQYPDAAAYVSVALAVGGRGRLAEQWLTEAVQELRADREAPEPTSAEDAGLLFFLLQQRHRIRHALGLPHDTHDVLAERLETRLGNVTAQAGAETTDGLVFWPQPEFTSLVAQWPALADVYGATWDEHRARLERDMARQAGSGRTDLALLVGSVEGLTAAAGSGGDPFEPGVRAAYARRLIAGTGKISWPPERNAQCWCGSGVKYKKCCLPRSRG